MGARIFGGEFGPLLEIVQAIVGWAGLTEPLENLYPPGPKRLPLAGKPTFETGAAFDLQAFEKLALKKLGANSEIFHRHVVQGLAHQGAYRQRIDETIPGFQAHTLAIRLEALAIGRVEQGPQLAQAPAQLAARVVRSIPCLLYTSPSPRDGLLSRMPSSA